jgi:hypothetical protein
MKLTISKKDKDGNVSNLGKFAVIVNDATDAMEVIQADTVQIDEIAYTRARGIFQMQVVLGGHDSTDKFHAHPKFNKALISIHRDGGDQNGRAIWMQYDLDNVERFDWKELKQMLIATNAIPVVAMNQWGQTDKIEAAIKQK